MMNIEQFTQNIQQFKKAREKNPQLNYWEWKNAINKYKGLDIDNDPTYDYASFYYESPSRAYSMLSENPNAHFTDKFKTPIHPTFSDESIYSNSNTPGGSWSYQSGRDVYDFSDYTFKHSNETLYLNQNY